MQLIRTGSIVLLIANGITAVAGGICLMLDRSGKLMQMSTAWLVKTIFENYFLPGLILFVAIGLFSIYAAFRFITNHKNAPACLILEGIFLSAWTLVQVLTFSQLSFLQPVYGLTGIVMLLLGLLLIMNNKLKPGSD